MNINEEQKYYVELRNRIKKTIDEMYTNIFNCEDSIEGLLHIAPTIFTHAEFLMLLADYKNLQQRISVFEHMATEINSQPDDMIISVDLAIKFDNAISALNLMFVLLMEYIDVLHHIVCCQQRVLRIVLVFYVYLELTILS